MKRFCFKMAVNTGIVVITTLCYALLMGLIMSNVDANVIKRREIATALQRNGDNRTVTTLTLHTPQNDNITKITKLMPQQHANGELILREEENSSSSLRPKKITLKMVTEAPEIANATQVVPSDINGSSETKDKQRLRLNLSDLPSTTAAMPNTIDTEQQELKEKHKTISSAHKKVEIKLAEILSTTEATTIPVTNKLEPYTSTTREPEISTTETLLVQKAQLSLEDSNEIQISSAAKQPKFLNDNSTNSNQLNLPNTASVWTLAGMKSVSPRTNQNHGNEHVRPAYLETTSNNKSSLLDPVKEKTLTDWTQIVQMGVDKSMGNALTEEQQNLDDERVTKHAMTPLPAHTTLSSQNLDEETEKSPAVKSNITPAYAEKIKLPNETTTLTPATSANSEQSRLLLSAIDNVDLLKTLKGNDTQYLTGEPNELSSVKNEGKIVSNEEHEEAKSFLTSSSQEESVPTTTTTTTTTMTMTTTIKMTTISTPATGSVSTTESTLEERRMQIDDKGEKVDKNTKDAAVINEIETTTISGGSQLVTTTKIPIEITTTPTTTTARSTILATNVEEVINLPTTTRQPSPDIYQISIKSNLETPTTTKTTATTVEEATIETTPTTTTTTIAQRVNSSAITNQTLKQAKDVDDDVTTTDSLSAQSTSSGELIFSTIIPATPVATTTTKITEIAATTLNILEATVAKDTTLSLPQSTTTPVSTLEHKQREEDSPSIESTTTNASNNVFEVPVGSSTTSNPLNSSETQIEQENLSAIVDASTTTTTTTVAFIGNNWEMRNATVPTSRESTNTEAPLTNFIDDSTATTSTTTAAPDPTISLITSSTSSPDLSVQTTNTVELHSINNETTPIITEETPTTTTTTPITIETTTPIVTTTSSSTETLTELPAFIPPSQQHTTTTTEKIVEMVPVTTQSNHFESPPSSVPISTTMNPLTFPDDGMSIMHAQPPKSTPDSPETDVNVVIAISVSVIGVVALILLVAFLYLMRKRQKATSYGQRCRPVSLDAYSLDNVSVLGSVRRKGALRASKRSYGNAAFDDPSLRHNVLQNAADLAKFLERRSSIFEEFRDVPQIIARPEEIPEGCENKNRYANVIPLPETRVILQRRNDDDTTEYINANYVRGPRDAPNYYIACQAPLESTVGDFWRLIWEQQSRVIIQATDLIENGVEKCAEYLPPSVTLDNHTTFGDFQVTLKNREVKDKYAISTIMLKNTVNNTCREITHYWYKWPEIGVPSEEAPIIAMLLEARSSLKSYALEVTNELKEKSNLSLSAAENENGDVKETLTAANGAGPSSREINGNVSEKTKNITRNQGPLTIHCSPGTGRTGTIIACDIAIRSLETTKSIDIPQIVYYIRRGRASAVQTKEQYEFIYKVANVYAMKITNVPNDN